VSFDRNMPQPPDDTGEGPPAKDYNGPRWIPGVLVGQAVRFGSKHWTVQDKKNRGRVIYWRCTSDGLEARTECTPAHPEYPKDPTREELREAARALKERKKAFFNTFGRWPTDAEMGC
jgi:hypothetical protein